MTEAPKPWAPPKTDQEWVVGDDIQSAPAWVDKGWKSAGGVAVPVGDPLGQPYNTQKAEKGDTVRFSKKTGEFTVEKAKLGDDPEVPDDMEKAMARHSGASVEDRIKNGLLDPGELDDDVKGQVAARSPKSAALVEADAA